MTDPAASSTPLLGTDDPEPVIVERSSGPSPFFLTCDHGGHHLPHRLGSLGISDADLRRHIGWDIGALEVALRVSESLDATLVAQIYSRLVIDCNRMPGTPASIPLVSEGTPIPGNRDLSPAARHERERELHAPYHEEITNLLDQRQRAGLPSVLVAIHSFTPVFEGVSRPWHISLAMDDDRRLGDALLRHFRASPELVVGDNEPYQINHVDYTIPAHGQSRRLSHVLVEIRQDLVGTPQGQREWADRLTTALQSTLAPQETGR